MIQSFFMNESKAIFPDLEWSIDYYSSEDNTGTVYSEGSGSPDAYDLEMEYPEYMIYIRSSDWDYAEYVARSLYKHFHKMGNRLVTVETEIKGEVITKDYQLFFINALSSPLRIGVKENDIMEWSINFRATLREV